MHTEILTLPLYSRAQCVVTSRLHCALPCLAFQTPVLLLTTARDRYRFDGLRDLLWHCSRQQLIDNTQPLDINQPMPNPDHYLKFRQQLITQTMAFTGYRSALAVSGKFLDSQQ